MEFAHTLNIDVETKSGADLTKVGMYKYMEDLEFEIILLAYSFDGGPVDCIDIANGENPPPEFWEWLFSDAVKKKAWNAAFEIHALQAHYGMVMILSQWECTMIKAVMLGLPASLDSAGIALGIRSKKMFVGKKLIRLFCMPCKPTKKNNFRRWNTAATNPNEWLEFKDYNEVDVYGEMEIGKTLDHFAIPETEQQLYILDQIINDLGVRVDVPFIEKAIAFNTEYTDKLIAEATAITGLQNVGSVKQLKEWLELEIDESVTTLTKDSVHTLLKGKPSDAVRRVLEIRQQISMASIKKYDAMLKMVCSDGYVRGTLQFYGAGRTARWAGRGVQVQNLRKNSMKDLGHAREVVRDRDLDLFELNWANPPDVLSQLVRTAFIPADGCTFLMSDFSAIEARVIAWYAGEEWKLNVFKGDGKIYEAVGANMFKVPIEKVSKGSVYRDRAKIAELACIAEGQKVLTNYGECPIESVENYMQVWDGESWVHHGGVVFKGIKKVITYEGLTATTDHIVWIEGQQKSIHFGIAAACGAHLIQSGNGGAAIRISANYKCRKKMGAGVERPLRTNQMRRMQFSTVDTLLQFKVRKVKRLSKMLTTKTDTTLAGQKINISKTTLRKYKGQGVQKLRGSRNKILVPVGVRCRALFNRNLRATKKKYGGRPGKQRWTLSSRKRTIRTTKYKSTQSARCYDIMNAGPNNRYTVSNVLVHNCGYQGSWKALEKMGGEKMGLTREEMEHLVSAWREANSSIVQWWYALEAAAIKAMHTRETQVLGNIRMYVHKGTFFVRLPSGRSLAYHKPELYMATTKTGKQKVAFKYHGVNPMTRQFESVPMYGGKWAENIVQATARDILAEKMLYLHECGHVIRFHVHDEVVLQILKSLMQGIGADRILAEVNAIMSKPLGWCKDLPLAADSYYSPFYRKD